MGHYVEELEKACEYVEKTLAKANKKLEESGGDLNGGDINYMRDLTGTLKNIKTILAMAESEDGYSFEGNMGSSSYARSGNSRGRGNSNARSYGGSSYTRGRGRGSNAKRDSMGRYSSERGYSYDDARDDMIEQLESIMESAPDNETRMEFEKFVKKLESM